MGPLPTGVGDRASRGSPYSRGKAFSACPPELHKFVATLWQPLLGLLGHQVEE